MPALHPTALWKFTPHALATTIAIALTIVTLVSQNAIGWFGVSAGVVVGICTPLIVLLHAAQQEWPLPAASGTGEVGYPYRDGRGGVVQGSLPVTGAPPVPSSSAFKPAVSRMPLWAAFAVMGLAGLLSGCTAFWTDLATFAESAAGQLVLTALGDFVTGDLEKQGMTAAQVNNLATQLEQVDYSTGTPLGSVATLLEAHVSNVSALDQQAATALVTAIGTAITQLYPASAQAQQTTTIAILQAIATASSPNACTSPSASGCQGTSASAASAAVRVISVLPGH